MSAYDNVEIEQKYHNIRNNRGKNVNKNVNKKYIQLIYNIHLSPFSWITTYFWDRPFQSGINISMHKRSIISLVNNAMINITLYEECRHSYNHQSPNLTWIARFSFILFLSRSLSLTLLFHRLSYLIRSCNDDLLQYFDVKYIYRKDELTDDSLWPKVCHPPRQQPL